MVNKTNTVLIVKSADLPKGIDIGDVHHWAYTLFPDDFVRSAWDGQFLRIQFNGGATAEKFGRVLLSNRVDFEEALNSEALKRAPPAYEGSSSRRLFILRQRGYTEEFVLKLLPREEAIAGSSKVLRGFLVEFKTEDLAQQALKELGRTTDAFAHFWPVALSQEDMEQGTAQRQSSVSTPNGGHYIDRTADDRNSSPTNGTSGIEKSIFFPKPIRRLSLQHAVLRSLPGFTCFSVIPAASGDTYTAVAHFSSRLFAQRAFAWLQKFTKVDYSVQPPVISRPLSFSSASACLILQARLDLVPAMVAGRLDELLEAYDGVDRMYWKPEEGLWRVRFHRIQLAVECLRDLQVLEFLNVRFEGKTPALPPPPGKAADAAPSVNKAESAPPKQDTAPNGTAEPQGESTKQKQYRAPKFGACLRVRNLPPNNKSKDLVNAFSAFVGVWGAACTPSDQANQGEDVYILFATNKHRVDAMDCLTVLTTLYLDQPTMRHHRAAAEGVRCEAVFQLPEDVADILDRAGKKRVEREIEEGMDVLRTVVERYEKGVEKERAEVEGKEERVQRLCFDVVKKIFEWKRVATAAGVEVSGGKEGKNWDGLERVFVWDGPVM
ncbi:hypothetical protein HK097_004457 [Rhizophlyctis rosea]|uniref:Uncharacterized protein n=1 Tax=Rhizophlyctis rosea TaxID=64517 RepID=A0AAD5SE36_9FUNG|nr:hypothetical protein HK097_004457 [Rhizophlyctis rosea]